jgi:hypothetical protein
VTEGNVRPTGVRGADTSATQDIARALDEADVLDPDRPLYECVDTEALERLRAHAAATDDGRVVTVGFRYGDSHVTVEVGEDVAVTVEG